MGTTILRVEHDGQISRFLQLYATIKSWQSRPNLDNHEKLFQHEGEPDLENLPAYHWQPGKSPGSDAQFYEEGFSRDGGVGKHELLRQVIQSEQQGTIL